MSDETEWVLVPREFLQAAVCPMKESGCDGMQYPVPPHGEGEQCQWCHERASALSAPQPPAEAQPVAWQFQDREGNWHGFINEKHRLSTIEDGSWPIRALYAHPPPSAPVGVDVGDKDCLTTRARELLADEYRKRGIGTDLVNDAGTATSVALAAIATALAQQPAAFEPEHEGDTCLATDCYAGNSVGWWKSKADAYRNSIGKVCDSLRDIGIKMDGNTPCWEYISRLQQPAADPLVEWANSPLNFTATVGVFKDGVQPAAVDGGVSYPTPRNRQEAAALAGLALAYLGVTRAHIDAVIARCETDLAAQPGGAE